MNKKPSPLTDALPRTAFANAILGAKGTKAQNAYTAMDAALRGWVVAPMGPEWAAAIVSTALDLGIDKGSIQIAADDLVEEYELAANRMQDVWENYMGESPDVWEGRWRVARDKAARARALAFLVAR